MDWQQEPIGKKLVLELFVKNYLCNSIGLFVSPAFFIFIIQQFYTRWQPLTRLALINHSYFN